MSNGSLNGTKSTSSGFDGSGAALAALPVLGSLASTYLSNKANAEATKYASDLDYQKWREYLDYSDPKDQVRRMRNAGMNPALAMANGAIDSGNPSSPAAETKYPTYDFSPIAQGMRDSVELYNTQRLQGSQARNLESQTRTNEIRNQTQLQRDLMEMLKMYSEVDKNSKEGELLWNQIQFTQKQVAAFDKKNAAEVHFLESQANEHDAHAKLLQAQERQQSIINQFTKKQQEIITDNLAKQGRAIEAAIARDNEQAALNIAMKALTEARKEGVDISNDVAEEIADLQVEQEINKTNESYWRSQNEGKSFVYGEGKRLPAFRDANGEYLPRSKPFIRRYDRKNGFKK